MNFFRNVMGAWALILSGMALCGLALSETKTLEAVTVTANPLGAADWIAPVMSLTGTELLLRTQPTLGETLSGMPGISSTYFGPNASRPVIRGLDGDRVRVLQNSGASGDMSALSYDHAVSLEPMLVERIEVLRGPAALMYGGSAVGGVVNVLDNRIAREAMFEAGGGVLGKANAGWVSGNREQSGAVMVETGTDRYALHVDAMSRNTQDVAVPLDRSCPSGGTTVSRSICNSASQSWGGALGGSMFFDQGYLGASLSTQGMSYGTVAEDEVRIGMQASRFRLEGELKDFRHTKMAGGWLQGLKMQFTRNQYQHTEFESEVPKTVFDSAGHEFRLEARHRKTGGWEGVLGLQLESNDFSAFGDEAFMPVTQTRSQALFVHEEYPTQWGRWSAGARAEQVQVASLGHPTLTQFQAASRSFTPQSYALGALWRVAPDWQLTTNLTWNERAPKDYELFANGTHVATNTIEIGRSNLGKEKSSNLDVGAAWKRGAHLAQVQAFVHEFSNFISLELSDASTSPYPTYTYTPVQARLTGLEASGNLRLLGLSQEQEAGVWTHTRGTLDLGARADTVRADNTSTGQALPRVAPMRIGAHLRWTQGPWSSRLGIDQVSAQDRVPTGQLATPGYQMWNAALTFREKRGATQLQWFARLDNMSDVLAYSATSILTQTAPGKAPLPGRSVRLGLQVSF